MAKVVGEHPSQRFNLNRTVLIEWLAVPRPRARLDHAAIAAAFAPDGLHGATSVEIARRAHVAKPTIYAHGGSKAELLLACVEAEVERLLSRLSEADLATRAQPPRLRLAAIARAVVIHGREQPDSARLIHMTARHASSSVAAQVDSALARVPARIAMILRADTTAASAELLAPALLGAAAAFALAPQVDPEQAAATIGDAFAAVLDPGDGPEPPEQVATVDIY